MDTAALGVMLGLSTNTISKGIVALAFRDRRQVARTWAGLLAILIAVWAGFAIQTTLT